MTALDERRAGMVWTLSNDDNSLIPPDVLPRCAERRCSFRFRPVEGVGLILEHHDPKGEISGELVFDEELADVNANIWDRIRPYYEALHEEDGA